MARMGDFATRVRSLRKGGDGGGSWVWAAGPAATAEVVREVASRAFAAMDTEGRAADIAPDRWDRAFVTAARADAAGGATLAPRLRAACTLPREHVEVARGRILL